MGISKSLETFLPEKDFFFLLFLCMRVHGALICKLTRRVCMPMSTWEPEDIDVLLSHSPSCYFEEGSLPGPGAQVGVGVG